MELITGLFDFILHIDEHLHEFIVQYDTLVYVLLFLIVFVETGLVIMPFLPGDSLLFAVGMFAAQGSLNLAISIVLLLIAAFLGDTVNYFVGKYFGKAALKLKLFGRNLVKQEHLDKTHVFYETYGSKTIIIARFVPFVRTFAPFVAGVGSMSYRTFLTYNIVGALLWVFGLTLAGYFLGEVPWIKNNFEKVIFAIIFISLLPPIIELVRQRRKLKVKKFKN